jgi:arylsulfatase
MCDGVLASEKRGTPIVSAVHPMAAAAGAFLKSSALEPPIKPGTPDPYIPPKPGEMKVEQQVHIGPITQYITVLSKAADALDFDSGLDFDAG